MCAVFVLPCVEWWMGLVVGGAYGAAVGPRQAAHLPSAGRAAIRWLGWASPDRAS